jgi:hypothetical protein
VPPPDPPHHLQKLLRGMLRAPHNLAPTQPRGEVTLKRTLVCQANTYYDPIYDVTVCVGALLVGGDAGYMALTGTWDSSLWSQCENFCVNGKGTMGGNLFQTSSGGYECWCKGTSTYSNSASCFSTMSFYKGESCSNPRRGRLCR